MRRAYSVWAADRRAKVLVELVKADALAMQATATIYAAGHTAGVAEHVAARTNYEQSRAELWGLVAADAAPEASP